jgi:serine/threonine-protein kinase SRPK3
MAALKVLVALLSDKEENGIWDELGMLKVIQERNPHSDGYRHVCQLVDNFTHQGPNGNHICLVLEVMQLDVHTLNVAFSKVMPWPPLARLSKHLLRALAYLHDECGIIHTGKIFFGRSQVLILRPPQISKVTTYLWKATHLSRPSRSAKTI